MPSSLLITILCDSLSWFVTVARLKERSAGWGTRMALAWARQGVTRTKRRRERKKSVLRSARKLVISWNEIFFSRVSFVAGSDRPRSPRDSSFAGGTIDGSAISKLPIIREIARLASLCLPDGSAVTSDKGDLRSSYFQLITAIHYGEGRRTRVCVRVRTYDAQCWNLLRGVFKNLAISRDTFYKWNKIINLYFNKVLNGQLFGISLKSFPYIIRIECIETFKSMKRRKKKKTSIDIPCIPTFNKIIFNTQQIFLSPSSPLPKLTITSESRGDTPLQQNLYTYTRAHTHLSPCRSWPPHWSILSR